MFYIRNGVASSNFVEQTINVLQSLPGNGVSLPPPLLTSIKIEDLRDTYVTSLNGDECRDVSVAGGKGASLGLLSTVQSSEVTLTIYIIVN